MNDSQDDFSPMLIDQQIDHPDTFLSPEDARFVHEVRALFEQEKSEWIKQGWTRLVSQRTSANQQSEVLDLSAYRQSNERISAINEIEIPVAPTQAPPQKRLPRRLSLLAAVLVCVTLIGSLPLVLIASRNQSARTSVSKHDTTVTAQTGTATPIATPTLTIPPACKNTLDLADEVLCAKGEETILHITRSFTVTVYNPNSASIGSGTVSVTFHRAYADTSRLMLVYTINRAPGGDWGGFVTLSTHQGYLGSNGDTLIKGFFVQSFDTSGLPTSTAQLQIRTIHTAYGASIPLSFTLPFHTTSKTVSVKQTATGKGATFTLDHLVLTGSTTIFALTYKTQNTKDAGFTMKVQAMIINGQQQAIGFGLASDFHINSEGGITGSIDLYQSFLDQTGSWIVKLSLVKIDPGFTLPSLLTGTFTFTVSA